MGVHQTHDVDQLPPTVILNKMEQEGQEARPPPSKTAKVSNSAIHDRTIYAKSVRTAFTTLKEGFVLFVQ